MTPSIGRGIRQIIALVVLSLNDDYYIFYQMLRLFYLLLMTCTLANPVTTDLDSDELMLTGPSPWNILILASFMGSMVSTSAKPSTPVARNSPTNYLIISTYKRFIHCTRITCDQLSEELLNTFCRAFQEVGTINFARLDPVGWNVRTETHIFKLN